jgi:TusA-related sulfurtransferase
MSLEPIILDVLGQRCPMPVQRTRKFLKNAVKGSIVHVLGDDPESLHDIPVLLVRLGLEPAVISEEETGWKFIIRN